MGSNKGKKTFMGANFVIAVWQFFNRQNLNEIDFCNGFRFEITGAILLNQLQRPTTNNGKNEKSIIWGLYV